MPYATHDDYIAAQPADLRGRLQQVQAEIERRVPGANRCISYQMPAFKAGRIFVYFAAFSKHLGIYPPVTDDPALMAETRHLRGPKGNLSFPHAEPLPLELIGRVALALHRQYARPRDHTPKEPG